ncbi:MAG: ribosome biogenesis GTPase YlqF, partial [Clostridia bacterium]|nr:ribosome biogenesis GTPase YlqF [Clostridia bacterium]
KEALLDKYSLNSIDENNLVNLENIAKAKHYVLKGNEIDWERTATSVIQDFRKGALGKFILDTYENRN